jgi:hypothetical protein
MLLLLPLAVRIEPLAESADVLLEGGFFERGEWESSDQLFFAATLPNLVNSQFNTASWSSIVARRI